MSRIGYSEEEDRPGQFALWQANCDRSLAGKKGQAALRELESALIALPEKRLIAEELQNKEGEVCAVGALAKAKGRADELQAQGEHDMEGVGVALGMPPLVAWRVVALNDIELEGATLVVNEGPYRWPSERPTSWQHLTPELRYEKVLAWVRKQLIPSAVAACLLFLFALTTSAQTFPRWPQGQTVKVYTLTNAFTGKEHTHINSAVESWRPLLPSGITLTLASEVSEIQSCQGCVTLDRKPTRKDEWGECKTVHDPATNIALYSEISIDPRAGSGDNFQRVAEHEIGHVLGLDHRAKSVMSPHPKRGPSRDDRVILRGLYAAGLTALNVSKVSPPVNADNTKDIHRLDERFKNSVDIRPTAQREAATMLALEQHGFTRTVSVQTLALDDPTIVTGTYERISRMVLADNGERVEKVLNKHSHLKNLRITKADEEDFSGAQMGLIDFADYRFTQGNGGAIHVEPLTLDGRKFSGDIWLGDKGIVRMVGTTLPERKERFPVVTVTRREVDGHLFPSEARGEGVLMFPTISIRVRWSVRESDYYRFGSRVSVSEVEQ